MHSNMHKRGFTLIEMMVAVGLFVVVALISTSALIAMSSALRRAQNVKTIVEATSIAMDSMALRMTTKGAIDFVCTPSCNPNSAVSSLQFTYGLTPNAITYLYKLNGTKVTLTKTPQNGSPSISDLTPPTVHVDGLKFYVTNRPNPDFDQATILLNVSATADPTAKAMMQVTITAP